MFCPFGVKTRPQRSTPRLAQFFSLRDGWWRHSERPRLENRMGEVVYRFWHAPLQYACIKHDDKPLGHHTFGIECRGVLSTGVSRMLAWNPAYKDLSRNTMNSSPPFVFPVKGGRKLHPDGSELPWCRPDNPNEKD